MIRQSEFGRLENGDIVTAYEMENFHGMELSIIDYGCTIAKMIVPDKNGQKKDIVLGFDSLEYYLDGSINPYYGCRSSIHSEI